MAACDGIEICGFGTLTSPARTSVRAERVVVGVVRLEGAGM